MPSTWGFEFADQGLGFRNEVHSRPQGALHTEVVPGHSQRPHACMWNGTSKGTHGCDVPE